MGHTPQNVLREKMNEALAKVTIGGKYFHYKSPEQIYTLINVAIIEDGEEPAVIYQADYDERITWIRPISEFFEEYEIDGKKVTKFTLVS